MARLVVGLTGGIGSGKSAAARLFRELGAAIVDADEIAHELTSAGGVAIPAIRDPLGPEFIDGSGALDRVRTRTRVFSNPRVRKALESVLHPLIRREVIQRVSESRARYVVVVIPLLFETGGYSGLLSRIAVVDCPEALQIARTRSRSGLSESEIRSIMSTQVPRSTRLAGADDVLNNLGSLEELGAQVRALHEKYLRIASPCDPGNP